LWLGYHDFFFGGGEWVCFGAGNNEFIDYAVCWI